MEETQTNGLDKKKIVLIAGVAVVAAAAIAYYFLVLAAPASAVFAVTVIGAEGEKITGATVEVFDGADLIASATTADGRAELPELPKKLLSIRITTPDGKRTTRLVDLSRSNGLRIDFSQATAGNETVVEEGMQVEIKDSETKQGVANAKIVYKVDRNTETTTTNAAGRATIFVSTGVAVGLRVSAAGYYTESRTIIANAPLPTIELRSKDPSAQITFSEEEAETTLAGRVTVLAEDFDTAESIESGTACIFSSETAEQLGCADIIEGSAEITGLELGTTFYAVVNATGYYEYSNAMDSENAPTVTDLAIINARLQRVPIELYASGALAYTIIRTVDENGAPVSATVQVLPYPSIVALPAKQSKGELQLTLSNESTFYAIAYADGRVPGMTGEFEAGSTQTITLPTATKENSASLEVIATDEDDQALSGATVTVLLDGLLALPPAQTALRRVPTPSPQGEGEEITVPTEPSAFFAVLPLGLNYELRGKYQKGVGNGYAALVDDLLLRLPLLVNSGFLDVYASDFVSGKGIPNARFELKTADSVTLSSCDGSPCTLVARAYSTGSVYATAPGYLPTTRPLNSKDVVAGATKTISLSMLPAGAVNATIIQFTGLTDENGDAVYDLVRANNSYFANFVIASNNAARTGAHVRVGSAAEVKSDKAGIIDFAPPANFDMAKSTSYHASGSCESDLRNSNPEGELVKWVDLSFAGAGTANIAIPIQVKDSAKNGDNLTVYYRGYSYIQTSAGTRVYSRVPSDKTLGINENTSGRASCYAETNSTSYGIIVPVVEETPVEPTIPLPKADFTVSDTIVLESGSLRSVHGLEEYVLQIDPIFPADAMPIKLKSKMGGCTILVSPVSGNSSTSKCFRYDATLNKIIFESKEINPLCPVHVEGNKLYNGGREFKGEQGASITYRVAGCDINSELTVPLRVVTQDADSVFAAPDGNELGDGDAAKPLYLVNEKQLGARDVNASFAPLEEGNESTNSTSPKETVVSLYGGSAQAMAFRGPGTLTLSDGQEILNEVFYQDTLKVMKEGVGTTGYRKTSCDDYKCCSHGWCTRKALKQALKDFQEKAPQLAAKTAFRRGGSEPFKTFSPEKQFSFATVAQMIQGVDSLLPESNFTVEKTDYEQGNCANGTPAVFELKANADSAENFSYSAKVLSLYKFAYVDAQCEEGFETQGEGPYASLEYQPLCSFLYGDGNCVARANESNPLTMDQTSHLNLKVTICMYPSFEVVSLPLCVWGCTIGWMIYSACETATSTPLTAAAKAACQPKKPDDTGTQTGWLYHKILSNVLVPKIPVFNINQDIPYDESTTQDAFEKIGHAFSNIDFKNIDYADGMSTCFAINTNWEWQIQNLVNNMGGPSGFNYQNWLNSLLPVIAAHGCSCGAQSMWKGLPAYSPPDSEHPKCYGLGSLAAAAGTAEATGVPWGFSFGTTGNNVFLRFDVGVEGNCKIQNPFSKAAWGKNAKEIVGKLLMPLGMSLLTYMMTDQKDFAITLSTNPTMGDSGPPNNGTAARAALEQQVDYQGLTAESRTQVDQCWQAQDCQNSMTDSTAYELASLCPPGEDNAACQQTRENAAQPHAGETSAQWMDRIAEARMLYNCQSNTECATQWQQEHGGQTQEGSTLGGHCTTDADCGHISPGCECLSGVCGCGALPRGGITCFFEQWEHENCGGDCSGQYDSYEAMVAAYEKWKKDVGCPPNE